MKVVGCSVKRLLTFLITIFICTIFLASCNQQSNDTTKESTIIASNKKLDYATEEPFIITSTSYAGEVEVGAVENSYSNTVSIDTDGNVTLYAEEYNNEDAPMVETTISKSEVENVQKLIEATSFWELEEDISDNDSNDGHKIQITVQLMDESKTVRGLNPLNEAFNELGEHVYYHYIDLDQHKEWEKEIEQYILEVDPDVH